MTSVMVQIILMTICKAQVPQTVFYTCNTEYIHMPGSVRGEDVFQSSKKVLFMFNPNGLHDGYPSE